MEKDDKQEETNASDELKRRMKGVMELELYEDDNLFYRFLRAKKFNVDNAEIMLKEHLEWRKTYDVKNISQCKHPEVLGKYLPFNKLGYDKEGCSVLYFPPGTIDWIGINASCKFEDCIKYCIHHLEEEHEDLKMQSKKLGKTVDKLVSIHNLENFSFEQATDKKVILNFIEFIKLYQNNYPRLLKTIYVLNVSMYFNLFFSMVQNFVSSSILKKMKIYSDDSWKDDLLETIDAEVLPAFLGGKRTDPDGNPLCSTFINHGGSVPKEYYIHRSKRSLASLPDVQHVTLSRASFHEVFMEVKEPDCYLEWEFETESRDIGFGLFYEDDEKNKVEIIPIQRINTDEYAEGGIYKCENVGTYIVVFDNTYSLLRRKDIFYKIKVLWKDMI